MTRRSEPPVVLVKWYDFTKWVLGHVDNFPKNQRFVFGQRLADEVITILELIVNSGTSGNLTTLEPQLSPMLWTSIATGKMAYHHGVPGFTEVDPQSGGIVPVSAATRKCTTVWEMLAEKGLKSHIVSWFATQGEQNIPGKMVSNMYCHVPNVPKDSDPDSWPPPPPGTYWPEVWIIRCQWP